MKELVLTLTALACACALGVGQLGSPHEARASAQRFDLRSEIADVRADTWRWQRVMGMPRSPATRVTAGASAGYQRSVLRLWTKRANRLRHRAQHPPHKREFLCIHRYEAPWTAATGNGYYGGLQMDISFQRNFGRHLYRRKGTADRWTPLEQIWVAERAHRASGFAPWPNTARFCGLL